MTATFQHWGLTYEWSHRSPLKLFEYMACGKPVIASRVGQLESVIQDGIDGLLVDNSPEDVVKKILFLRESRQQLPQMGALARDKVVQYYNWERIADATLDVFRSLPVGNRA